jgi:peroxiredoxin (alkyl hydroperoxide reductase subunit C)
MINLGERFPEITKKATVSIDYGKEFTDINTNEHMKKNRWMVMFWYPKDFTFVCPTEISEFNNMFEEFNKRNTDLIGASTDSEYVHLAWRKNHKDLKDLKFPLIADTSKSLADALGILEKGEKIAYRVTLITDPKGIVRWICANDLDVGRNVNEVVRVLDALQSGALTPCNWKQGDKTL